MYMWPSFQYLDKTLSAPKEYSTQISSEVIRMPLFFEYRMLLGVVSLVSFFSVMLCLKYFTKDSMFAIYLLHS